MTLYLNRSQSQGVDRMAIQQFGMLGLVLMENAARGAVETLRAELDQRSAVLILAGPGNNGGDGMAMARHLHNHGVSVAVIWFVSDPSHASSDCQANAAILRQTRVPVRLLATSGNESVSCRESLDRLCLELKELLNRDHFDWIVDALLGTGAKGPARSPMDEIIQWINQQSEPVLAVDIPSGMDCETGVTGGPIVKAEVTTTFVAAKQQGHASEQPPMLSHTA